jgi:hypothetical protein
MGSQQAVGRYSAHSRSHLLAWLLLLLPILPADSKVEFECGRIDEAELCRIFFADGRPVDAEALKRMLVRFSGLLVSVCHLMTGCQDMRISTIACRVSLAVCLCCSAHVAAIGIFWMTVVG